MNKIILMCLLGLIFIRCQNSENPLNRPYVLCACSERDAYDDYGYKTGQKYWVQYKLASYNGNCCAEDFESEYIVEKMMGMTSDEKASGRTDLIIEGCPKFHKYDCAQERTNDVRIMGVTNYIFKNNE